MRLRAARSGQMTHQNLSTAAVQSRTCPLLWTTQCCRQRLAACFRTGDCSALAQHRKGAALDASVRASGWKRARQGAGGAWRRFSPGPSAGRLGKRCAPRIELVTPHARPEHSWQRPSKAQVLLLRARRPTPSRGGQGLQQWRTKGATGRRPLTLRTVGSGPRAPRAAVALFSRTRRGAARAHDVVAPGTLCGLAPAHLHDLSRGETGSPPSPCRPPARAHRRREPRAAAALVRLLLLSAGRQGPRCEASAGAPGASAAQAAAALLEGRLRDRINTVVRAWRK